MTSSKSDLEAKEGQIPNESNFLEFVSLLGSLSTRGGGASTQEEEGPESKEEAGTSEESECQQKGMFLHCLDILACMSTMSALVYELLLLLPYKAPRVLADYCYTEDTTSLDMLLY